MSHKFFVRWLGIAQINLVKLLSTLILASLFISAPSVAPVYASGFVVSSTADSGPHTLRQAIIDANSQSGSDTITFASSTNGTPITLASELPAITSTITITGNGSANTIIQANSAIQTANYRLFEVAVSANLTLNKLTARNGVCNGTCATDPNNGAGIENAGTLTLTNTNLSGNSTSANGGAINSSGTLTLTNSIISNNFANKGNGIYNTGPVTITGSTFSGNQAICNACSSEGGAIDSWASLTVTGSTFSDNDSQFGGAIEHNIGTLNVTSSTFSGNYTESDSSFSGGGAIRNGATMNITNSTFSGNQINGSQGGAGGGIYNLGTGTITNSTFSDNSINGQCALGGGISNGGILDLANTTISGNSVDFPGPGSGPCGANPQSLGGGLYNSNTLNLKNTLAANNTATTSGGDCYNTSGDTLSTNLDNLIEANGPSGHMCDTPLLSSGSNLGPLANNGGLTPTFALLTTPSPSTAINAGDNATCSSSPVNGMDQRGVPRPQGANCDIGSYELFASGLILHVVPNGLTTGTCNTWAKACDFQYALVSAVSGDQLWVKHGKYKPTSTYNRTISFALKTGVGVYGGFAGSEILRAQRNPAAHLTILSGDIGIPGNVSDDSFHVVTGFAIDSTAVLDGFIITAANANGNSGFEYGGGMVNFNGGGPTVMNVTFSNNYAIQGGGMFNYQSSPTVTNVTFRNNSAEVGGGMANDTSANTKLTNVTFNGNKASIRGGGMWDSLSSPTLRNVTFTGNSAVTLGGAMLNGDGSPHIYDSIFWNDGTEIMNFSSTPMISNSLVAGGCPSGATCTTPPITANPLLGPLGNNGGFTPTMALSFDSPAIDKGNNLTCASTDQRGVKRPQGSHCDIGAYEAPQKATFYSNAAQDGWLLETGEDTGKGASFNNTGPTLSIGDDVLSREYRSVLSFSTASLPNNAVISSVTLKLKRSSVSPPGSNPISVMKGFMVDLRKGFFGTSASLQVTDFQAPAAITRGPFYPALSAGYYSIKLPAGPFINLLPTNGGVTQFRLRFRQGDNENHIADLLNTFSGNNLTASNRPALIIVYTTP